MLLQESRKRKLLKCIWVMAYKVELGKIPPGKQFYLQVNIYVVFTCIANIQFINRVSTELENQ